MNHVKKEFGKFKIILRQNWKCVFHCQGKYTFIKTVVICHVLEASLISINNNIWHTAYCHHYCLIEIMIVCNILWSLPAYFRDYTGKSNQNMLGTTTTSSRSLKMSLMSPIFPRCNIDFYLLYCLWVAEIFLLLRINC